MLENHADFTAYLVNMFDVIGQFDTVYDDLTLLVLFQVIDAANHGRFAGTGWPADDDALAPADFQIDVFEYVKFAVPFMYAVELHANFGRTVGSGR